MRWAHEAEQQREVSGPIDKLLARAKTHFAKHPDEAAGAVLLILDLNDRQAKFLHRTIMHEQGYPELEDATGTALAAVTRRFAEIYLRSIMGFYDVASRVTVEAFARLVSQDAEGGRIPMLVFARGKVGFGFTDIEINAGASK